MPLQQETLHRLNGVASRLEEITHRLQEPAVVQDHTQYRSLMKEYDRLVPVVEAYKAYGRAQDAAEEAKALLDERGLEPEFWEMVQQELKKSRKQLEQLTQTLQLLLLPRDENDDKNIVFEIRAGTGGEEAALFAHSLWRMYAMYAQRKGWQCEVLNCNETELGGVKEVSFSVEGQGAYSRLKFEGGVHRVQRVPETEMQGRIHTSAVTVAIMPEAEEVDLELDPAELKIDTFRSSGAGGQHINKTSSAVRLIHKPTGIVVASQQERSQFQNKDNCMKQLRAKLIELKIQQHAEKISDIKGVQMKIEWGSQIRSYVFMPYQLVKDTRTGYETSQIDNVMDGDLDGFLNAYLTQLATGELKK